jgi:hypothetical protein
VLVVYRAADDVRAANWVGAGVRGFAESVVSLVPAGFAEYVRLFHPAYRGAGSKRVPVAWREIASANGTRMHAGVQLGSISGSETYESRGQPGVFDQPPETGSLPRELMEPLAELLARHTGTPDRCCFAVWDGWGWLPPEIRCAPTFSVPQRSYHLLTGPLETVDELAEACGRLGATRSPNLWWPQDQAWCVATEVDLKTTYIGADRGMRGRAGRVARTRGGGGHTRARDRLAQRHAESTPREHLAPVRLLRRWAARTIC